MIHRQAETQPISFQFDNSFFRELPGDPEIANYRRQVKGACYSRVSPTEVGSPELAAYSKEAAALLELSEENCRSKWFTQVFSGNRLLPGMAPHAMCYGGHQFGNWAGQLGDGRAINLGEVINSRSERWALQLKGAGPTPYSRNADGLAVLRSSLREFLCSEAMFHLGVPTTRALSLIVTGDLVERDMFYDGHPKEEPGAVVCRMAPSFTRFGNFQLFAFREDTALLRRFLEYTIRTDFPELDAPFPNSGKAKAPDSDLPDKPTIAIYLKWFREVCRRTADMIVHWMRVGFVHGVMNTDNMSILGLTIDYGPYGWLENYDPDWTPNTTDAMGRRYRFGNQPQIAHWNLARLANAVYPLIGEAAPLEEALDVYSDRLKVQWRQMMAGKLGIHEFDPEQDTSLCQELFALLAMVETDMTLFFRNLATFPLTRSNNIMKNNAPTKDLNIRAFNSVNSATVRHAEMHASIADTGMDSGIVMPFMDAFYVPEQLDADYRDRLKRWLTSYARRLGREGDSHAQRQERMNRVNPKYVLRNYLAQLAIDKAETGDYHLIHDLLEVLRNPYDEQPGYEEYAAKRPEWARHRPGCSMLSCSS